MTFSKYIEHYFTFPQMGIFILISLGIVLLIHWCMIVAALIKTKKSGSEVVNNETMKTEEMEEDEKQRETLSTRFVKAYKDYVERYYELMFSTTSILFFIGFYFWIDFDYFGLLSNNKEIWNQYSDFLLLAFIIISIIINTILDHIFVPLKHVEKAELSILRMTGMVYMLLIFAYIKFIYEDNNYDTIIVYFLTLVIGRFVYFDASFKDFLNSMKRLLGTIPVLILVLLSTALLAYYGFGTEYLLRSNGVVMSLFIAHFFCVVEIFVLARTRLGMRIVYKKLKQKEK